MGSRLAAAPTIGDDERELPRAWMLDLAPASARGWLGFERVLAPAVDRSVLTAVHPERLKGITNPAPSP